MKKKYIIGGILLILLVISIIWITLFNLIYIKAKYYLSSSRYSQLQELYESNKYNDKVINKLNNIYGNYVNNIINKYINDKISFEKAGEILKEIDKTYIIEDFKNKLNNINESKTNFKNAEKAYNEDNKLEAITLYTLVIEDDKNNYKVAQSKINDMKIEVNNQLIEEVKTKLAENDFITAYSILNAVDEKILTEETLQYKNRLKEDTINNVLSQSEKNINEKDIKKAIGLIKEVKKIIDDNRLNEKYNEYSKLALKSLKQLVTVTYDDIDLYYTIVPKGYSTRYNNIGYNTNIEARILLNKEDKAIVFGLITGFNQRDWIFMDKITIDCGSEQFIWEVNYSDRITNVEYGYIQELYFVGDGGDFFRGEYKDYADIIVGDKKMKDLKPLIEAMGNASKVRIRFSGEGYKDVIIPQKHINNVLTIWEIYEILYDNPEFISELI